MFDEIEYTQKEVEYLTEVIYDFLRELDSESSLLPEND